MLRVKLTKEHPVPHRQRPGPAHLAANVNCKLDTSLYLFPMILGGKEVKSQRVFLDGSRVPTAVGVCRLWGRVQWMIRRGTESECGINMFLYPDTMCGMLITISHIETSTQVIIRNQRDGLCFKMNTRSHESEFTS